MRCHVTQFSKSRLPCADVGASYKNVKWRTPPKETDVENARIRMQTKRSFFMRNAQPARLPVRNCGNCFQSLDDGSVGLDSRFLYRFCGFGRPAAAKVSRCIIRTNDQHRSNQLSDECFSCRKHREPKTHPGLDVAAQGIDLSGGDALGE